MRHRILTDPFPHIIVEDVYEEQELELIWEEFNFFTKRGKLLRPEEYGGVVGKTTAGAIPLTACFGRDRNLSSILQLEDSLVKKLTPCLKEWKQTHYSIKYIPVPKQLYTKLRYYYDGEGYETHVDKTVHIDENSYYSGNGRYAITTFVDYVRMNGLSAEQYKDDCV